jgi:maleate isomerase
MATTIGVLYPDDPWVDEDLQELREELRQFLPEGVEMVSAHVYVPPGIVGVEEVAEIAASPDIAIAAQRLMRFQPACFAFLSTACSFINGPGHDTEIGDRIRQATGVQAVTTSSAVLRALRTLDIKRVATATPYVEALDKKLTAFLEGNGFAVVNQNPLALTHDHGLHPLETVRQAAVDTDRAEADGIFISCTGLKTSEIIEDLENTLGKPVVSANQASVWNALQLAGAETRLDGLGRLFRS